MQAKSWDQLKTLLTAQWPLSRWSGVGVVVGCSGGADSVALLRALAEIRLNGTSHAGFLVAAHLNHQTRGSESDRDEDFVCQLARQLDCRSVTGRASVELSDEASMRNARLRFLQQTAEATGARYVALAHTADDNVETVLHQLLRGSGPAGLCGIPPFRSLGPDVVLIRPLIAVRRQQVRSSLRAINQRWVEDSSNHDPSFRRNWIRSELLPLIETAYPKASDSVLRLIRSQSSWRSVIDRLAQDWTDEHLAAHRDRLIVRRKHHHEPVIVQALQNAWDQQGWARGEMTAAHWQRLVDTLNSRHTTRYMLPGDLLVDADGDTATIEPASRGR